VVELQPVGSGGEVTVESRLEITLENTAPASGLPDYVIGSTIPNLGRGVNRTFLTVYSPFDFQAATLDGTATGLETKTEFGYLANATFLDVPPGGSRTLVIDREGQLKLGRDGRYRLHLVRQPLEAPDDVEVVIEVPHGWRLVDGKGLEIDRSGRRARFVGALERDQTVAVRVEWAPTSLLDRLRAGT